MIWLCSWCNSHNRIFVRSFPNCTLFLLHRFMLATVPVTWATMSWTCAWIHPSTAPASYSPHLCNVKHCCLVVLLLLYSYMWNLRLLLLSNSIEWRGVLMISCQIRSMSTVLSLLLMLFAFRFTLFGSLIRINRDAILGVYDSILWMSLLWNMLAQTDHEVVATEGSFNLFSFQIQDWVRVYPWFCVSYAEFAMIILPPAPR